MLKFIIIIILYVQLKSIIGVLYSSRPGGTKELQLEGASFGWDVIMNLFRREVERRKQNKTERVPGLKESHVIRDNWTRLNVYPSKIIQVHY